MTMTSKFSGKCSACGVHFPAGTPIDWVRGGKAKHLTPADCAAAKAALAVAPAPATTFDGKPIAAFLAAARERGLKYPKVRFLAPGGGELRLSLAGSKAAVPGSIQVVVDGVWKGQIRPDGDVVGYALAHDHALLATITAIAADPVGTAKAYGAVTGNCSYCNLKLSADGPGGSVDVGYGPRCAKNYGLPHKRGKAAPEPKMVPVSPAMAAWAAKEVGTVNKNAKSAYVPAGSVRICEACGGVKPVGQSCGCFDNHCE